MINVIIASLISWFPGDCNILMFTSLASSHFYIYVYDHSRVLRSVSTIYISSFSVDWWAQWVFSIPCAIIVSALTFKLNCEPYLDEYLPGVELVRLVVYAEWGTHCDKGFMVWIKVCIALVAHIVIHTALLLHVVPLFCAPDRGKVDADYSETATRFPCSWFSGNLLHCLRSEYIYERDPPFRHVRERENEQLRKGVRAGPGVASTTSLAAVATVLAEEVRPGLVRGLVAALRRLGGPAAVLKVPRVGVLLLGGSVRRGKPALC